MFLVRHAEKVDQSKDPDLSPDGYRRAEELACVLADADIEHIHSSDFIRTRLTAAPVAEKFGLDVIWLPTGKAQGRLLWGGIRAEEWGLVLEGGKVSLNRIYGARYCAWGV